MGPAVVNSALSRAEAAPLPHHLGRPVDKWVDRFPPAVAGKWQAQGTPAGPGVSLQYDADDERHAEQVGCHPQHPAGIEIQPHAYLHAQWRHGHRAANSRRPSPRSSNLRSGPQPVSDRW